MSLFSALTAQLSLLLASWLMAVSPLARDGFPMASLWLRTRHESFPSLPALLSPSSCFLTRIEPLVALQDSLRALLWSRIRCWLPMAPSWFPSDLGLGMSLSRLHKTLLSLSPCSLTRIEPIMVLQDSLMAFPGLRTRHESSLARKTPLSLFSYFHASQ